MALHLRQATDDDLLTAYEIIHRSHGDLLQRLSIPSPMSELGPAELTARWEARGRGRSLFEHLARTAESFWVAEIDHVVVGYARTILAGCPRFRVRARAEGQHDRGSQGRSRPAGRRTSRPST